MPRIFTCLRCLVAAIAFLQSVSGLALKNDKLLDNVVPSNTSPNPEFLRNGQISNEEAGDWLHKYHECHPGYIRETAENTKQAELSAFYSETISSLAQKFPEQYEELGESGIFALMVAGAENFKCTSQTVGCEGIPTCSAIAQHIREHQKDLTSAQVMDFTRKTLFTLRRYAQTNKHLNTYIVGIQPKILNT